MHFQTSFFVIKDAWNLETKWAFIGIHPKCTFHFSKEHILRVKRHWSTIISIEEWSFTISPDTRYQLMFRDIIEVIAFRMCMMLSVKIYHYIFEGTLRTSKWYFTKILPSHIWGFRIPMIQNSSSQVIMNIEQAAVNQEALTLGRHSNVRM